MKILCDLRVVLRMFRLLPHAIATHLEFFVGDDDPLRDYFAYRQAADALGDPRGRTVRQAPWRRTVMHDLGGRRVFCKHRRGRIRDAIAEKLALRALTALGLNVPRMVFFAVDGGDSILGMERVPGRPLDALLHEGREADRALAEMPKIVRTLHGAGLAYRDLYWNHVFGEEGKRELWLVDVERVFRPRSRFDRWVVKDLACLVSSWPASARVSRSAALRFLRESLGGLPADTGSLVQRILAKAARIRGHVTKYPG